MKLRSRAFQLGAALALCSLAAACTQPQTPQEPTPTPSPASTSPSETQLERQTRLDFEAAEKAYRANMTEQDRVFGRGVAKEPTPVLQQTSAGDYLELLKKGLKSAEEDGWYTDDHTVITGVSQGSYKPGELSLVACEDYRNVHLVYKSGKKISPPGSRLYVQNLTVARMDGRWKVTHLESDEVKTFVGETRCGV